MCSDAVTKTRKTNCNKGAHQGPWNSTCVERMLRLWRDGQSASQIAAKLGSQFTRNAVISKIHRMGLAEREKSDRRLSRRKPQVPAPRKQATGVGALVVASPPERKQQYPERRSIVPAEEIATATLIAPMTAVTLFDLRRDQCRWPYKTSEGYRFCASPSVTNFVNGLPCPFCETHARIAYAPRPTREWRASAGKDVAAPKVRASAFA